MRDFTRRSALRAMRSCSLCRPAWIDACGTDLALAASLAWPMDTSERAITSASRKSAVGRGRLRSAIPRSIQGPESLLEAGPARAAYET